MSAVKWVPVSTSVKPSARLQASMAYDAKNKNIILFGGANNTTKYINNTWKWDGSTWTKLSPSTSPPGRYGASMAYDADRNCIIMFGGAGFLNNGGGIDKDLTDTWEWNGTNWINVTPIDPVQSPSSGKFSSMAYDANHKCIILSVSETDLLNATWKWDGSIWTKLSPSNGPSFRVYTSMAYDEANKNIIMFGGGVIDLSTSSSSITDETWKWNGSNWEQLNPMNRPSIRAGASMAYDGKNLILFGGGRRGGGDNYLNDTWKWNGSNWINVTSANPPSIRAEASMVYDGKNIILFGGGAGATYLSDMWRMINVPGAPTGVTVTPGKNGTATVSWKAPANGGAPITGYTVKQNPGNKIVTTTKNTTATIKTTKGTYTYSVTATNMAGTSPSASSKPIKFNTRFPMNAVVLKPISF